MAGWTGSLGIEEIDNLNESFAERSFDFESIKDSSERIVLFNSRDDPYVPFEKAEQLKRDVNAELIEFDSAGHFNEDAGYTEFQDLLEKIRSDLSTRI